MHALRAVPVPENGTSLIFAGRAALPFAPIKSVMSPFLLFREAVLAVPRLLCLPSSVDGFDLLPEFLVRNATSGTEATAGGF
jgi:hypothetical protein